MYNVIDDIEIEREEKFTDIAPAVECNQFSQYAGKDRR